MPNYGKLRDLVSHRVQLDFDSGARLVGYVAACKPETGPVLLLNLSRAELRDASGNVLEQHDQLSVVPNVLVGVNVVEGPSGRS